MKIFEKGAKETIYKVTETLVGIQCDICKERILDTGGPIKPVYYRVTTGHTDWGNDSCESIENYDVCPHCLTKFMEGYFEKAKGSQYMEIQREVCYKHDFWSYEKMEEGKDETD